MIRAISEVSENLEALDEKMTEGLEKLKITIEDH
jgi:hypothetical protein